MPAESSAAPVRRSIRLSDPERDEAVAAQTLHALPGVTSVTPGAGALRVRYDPGHVDYAGVQAALREAGVALSEGRWARLKSAWFSYLDGNARANATAGGGGNCCSNPTDVYSRRGRRG